MRRTFLVVMYLTTAAPWIAVAPAADDLPLAPRHGVLLLNNGELIEGTVTFAGDRYDVNLKDGELHLKRSDVAALCNDALECYRHKCAGIEEGRVQDHLDLVEWCLKNKLIPEAEKELAAARAADSGHPRIALMEARLRLAKDDKGSPRPLNVSDKTAGDAQQQLDRMVRNLPAGSVESFTNTVQPILLNNCSRSGCHGAQSTHALRLERISARLAGRHPTQRNLQAALALVDRQSPDESKLLQAPIRAHGTLKGPIFTDREQAQYKQLVQWVYLVSNMRGSAEQPSLTERGAPLLQTLPRGEQAGGEPPENRPDALPAAAAVKTPVPAEAKKPADSPDWSDSFPDQGRDATNGDPARQAFRATRIRGQTVLRPLAAQADAPPEFTPRDPVDPEIFNHRFQSPR